MVTTGFKGWKKFNSMKFFHGNIELEVKESIYYPREDSELLAGVIETMDIAGRSVLEVGCGSGLISIVAAKMGANVAAADVNPEAVRITEKNAEANKVSLNVFTSDLFENVNGKFDLIIFNPPYLPVEEGETDLTYAGGASGREVIERFIGEVENHLNKDGFVLLLISSLTGEQEVLDLFHLIGMKTEIEASEKVSWEELIVIKAK
jgi:release factor glutamine methyltransferase